MMVLSASQSRAADFDKAFARRLQIESRAADDLKHVGGRGLLLQRLGEVARLRLNLFEQPHIARWRSPPGRQRSVATLSAFVERVHLETAKHNRSNALTLAQHRHAQNRAMPLLLERLACLWELIPFRREQIVHMHRYHIDDRTAGDPVAVDRPILQTYRYRYRTVMRADAEIVANLQEHDGIISLAKFAGTLDDSLEDRLNIGR